MGLVPGVGFGPGLAATASFSLKTAIRALVAKGAGRKGVGVSQNPPQNPTPGGRKCPSPPLAHGTPELRPSSKGSLTGVDVVEEINLPPQQRPGILAFLVKLYAQTRQVDAATKLLDTAVDSLSQQVPQRTPSSATQPSGHSSSDESVSLQAIPKSTNGKRCPPVHSPTK